MKITIEGWDSYNPRSDLKSIPWVRVENSIATSRKLFGLEPAQKWLWVYLLTLAAQQNKDGTIEADLLYIVHFSGVSEDHVTLALQHFAAKDLIKIDPPHVREPNGSVREPNVSGTDPIENVPNGTERTERNGTGTPQVGDPPPSGGLLLDLELAEAWAGFARTVSRTVKPDLGKWATTVRLLREKDGLTHEELRSMLAFVQGSHFWQHNAASLDGLRTKSKNGLKKWENILAAMRQVEPKAKTTKPIKTITTEVDLADLY